MTRLIPTLICVGALAACSTSSAKVPDVTDAVRQTLTQNNLTDVTVTQDREKGVVTLGGHVPSDAEKAQAEALAKKTAPDDIVANQIIVTPPGDEADAKRISTTLDAGIEKNLQAELLKQHADAGVHYAVKAGVVTLTGQVGSRATYAKVATIASEVPNVTQVINGLTVK